MKKYSEKEAKEKVKELGNWDYKDGTLMAEYKFDDFEEAMEFVNMVALMAEDHDHHPDIHISYSKVKLELITHSEDAITDKDFKLAGEIDNL